MCAEAVVQCVEVGHEWCNRMTIRTSLFSPALLSASVASVPVLADAEWCTVSTVARSAGACGGNGAVCVGPPQVVVQSADRSDISVLTRTAVTTRPSATVARLSVCVECVWR